MAAVMDDGDVREIACVMIPVGSTNLLLPNVTVAEILPWRRVKPLDGVADWCIGVVGWRGESIPVVRYEIFNGAEDMARRSGRCLVVMNRARRRDGLAFYAIAADDLPRLIHLSETDVETQAERLGPAETMVVRVGTDDAVIPSLQLIEDAIAALPLD